MASYTPLELPYFAPAPAPLPTYHEIVAHASSKTPSQRRRARDVLQIGEQFIVKYGKHIDFMEGENMLIVRHYTSIPVPILYAMYQHEPSGDKVIIMEYVAGEVLSNCYGKLDSEQRAFIAAQLRQHLSELRTKIPSPGFYGLPGGRPYLAHTWTFKRPAGPFASADEFLSAYFAAQFSGANLPTRRAIEGLKSEFLVLSAEHSASVFTHGDLQAQNIILRSDGLISIIDWESASFCPEYFEFFIYGTLDMVAAGLEKEKGDVTRYTEMVRLAFKAWDTYCRAKQ
ncbi:kinase-like domain-containing protein [Xylaria bambusicola]|uniref:kinase-like domain-containing protein n=1 Tax=Xylaria bambusicola TaxID=326684 RepID=UPI0020072480|nr:kinase-like domain-containing protein [Xylaria bambusicola]KAI0521001.1 kinase-like domain-containing protein [Xylaria bambusicola]